MKFTKILSVLMTVMLLCGMLAVLPASAENKLVFLPKLSETGHTDGGWWANDSVKCAANGDTGMTMNGYYRGIWVFLDSVVEKMPFLIMEVDSGVENLTRVTATHNFLTFKDEIDMDISGLSNGAICVNLLDFLAGTESPYNCVYIAFYVGTEEDNENKVSKEVSFSKLYLSDTDLDGNVYVPPTQPPVPDYPDEYEIRKQLPIAAEQITTSEDDPDRYNKGQFLMSENINVKPINDGKGMELTLKGNADGEGNIAWVFPYEWLEKTPYLVLEFANEGRADEGPRTNIIAYWEGVTAEEGGKWAKLEGVEGSVGANKYNGVNRWTLKYSLDEIDQAYKDKNNGASIADVKGQGIAIQLWLGVVASDGTTYDPLVVTNAYLMGYKEGAETAPGNTTTAAGGGDNAEGGDFPIVPVAIAVVAVIVIAGVVVIVMKKKK